MATDADLDELRSRLDALEQSAIGPAYTPLTGLKVAADGSFTYDFDGHVHARGVDLDAATFTPPATPAADEKVRWVSTTNGAVVAELGGYEVAASSRAYMQASHGAHSSRLEFNSGFGGSFDSVMALVNGVGMTIWDGNFSSGFLTTIKGGSGLISGGVNLWAGVSVHTDITLGAALIVTSASGFANAPLTPASWQLLFDGVPIGSQGFLFNDAAKHHQLGLTVGIAFNVAIGNHTIAHANTSALVTDPNDNCAWLLIG